MSIDVDPAGSDPLSSDSSGLAASKLRVQQISSEEIAAHSLSFSDYNGRLFSWQGGLYRAIPADQSMLYRELFEQGVVRSLIDKKLLVATAITRLKLDPYEMVLRHHRIPVVSYPFEWCDAMFKAAALLHLDFCIALDRYDCTTDDAHPINILFEGCEPFFVDFGSINRLRKDLWYSWPWPPYEQFCRMFLYPLLLKASGQKRLARWALHDFDRGVLKSDLDALIDRPWSMLRLAEAGARLTQASGQPLADVAAGIRPWLRKGYRAAGRAMTKLSGIKSSRGEFLQQVRAEVAGISLRNDRADGWLSTSVNLPENYVQVGEILSELSPKSVLDMNIGGSRGAYARLAANCGARVVAIDPKQENVSELYAIARAGNLNILPLQMNFASPSDGLSNSFLASAHRRLNCDLVMALSLDNEMVLKRGFDFVVKRLAVFASRWLLVEFVELPEPLLTTRWQERTIDCPWYRLDNFVTALGRQFAQVDVLPIDSAVYPSERPAERPANRRLLLCER